MLLGLTTVLVWGRTLQHLTLWRDVGVLIITVIAMLQDLVKRAQHPPSSAPRPHSFPSKLLFSPGGSPCRRSCCPSLPPALGRRPALRHGRWSVLLLIITLAFGLSFVAICFHMDAATAASIALWGLHGQFEPEALGAGSTLIAPALFWLFLLLVIVLVNLLVRLTAHVARTAPHRTGKSNAPHPSHIRSR